MFTVKHISPSGGETIIEANGDVMFHPYDGANSVPPSEAHVYVPTADGEIQPLYEGTIYVMNRFGTTVAKYDLSPPAPGISRGVRAMTAFEAQQDRAA
jgi:hypothetical protein